MDIVVDAAWVSGMLLASIRVGAFVVASPIFGKAIPATGRMALVLVLGYVFATPVEGSLDLGSLIVAAVTNVAVGGFVGFLTGLIFTLFTVAGGLLDFTSSLSSAQIFDPLTGSQNPVWRCSSFSAGTVCSLPASGAHSNSSESRVRSISLRDSPPLESRCSAA